VALSQARILYQNHSGDYPQVILTIPVTCRTPTYRQLSAFVFCLPSVLWEKFPTTDFE
jgi:hypothetical protein